MSNESDPNLSPKISNEEGEEEEDLFYFESDHLALKGNKEYSELLKTIFVLEAQREKAIKDYEKVLEIQKQALNDPLTFIEKIRSKEDVGIPPLQRIAEIPNIDWNSYEAKLPEDALKSLNSKGNIKGNSKQEENLFIVNNKYTDTHKKPWTSDEQKRLEELLEIYPPENIELRRFKKIAAALGNRTVKQVTSRVQKYFLKLYKAGLPIPGRIPKSAEKYKKSKLHMHQRHNHYLWKPTTFFPQLDIPVKMNEFEEVPGPSISHKAAFTSPGSSSSNYLLPKPEESNATDFTAHNSNDTSEIQLKILKQVKTIKEKEKNLCVFFSHFGYQCDFCDEEPIKGTRWHCLTCTNNSIDFCNDCVISQMYSERPHPFSHRLEPDAGDLSDSNSFNNADRSKLYKNNNNTKTYRISDSEKSDSEFSSDSDSDSGSVSAQENVTLNGGQDQGSDTQNSNDKFYGNSPNLELREKTMKMKLSRTGLPNNLMESNDTSDSQSFTDTQSVSYEYLRSNLTFDENN